MTKMTKDCRCDAPIRFENFGADGHTISYRVMDTSLSPKCSRGDIIVIDLKSRESRGDTVLVNFCGCLFIREYACNDYAKHVFKAEGEEDIICERAPCILGKVIEIW